MSAIRLAAFATVLALRAAASDDGCVACHGTRDGAGPFVDPAEFAASVHGAHGCLSCHPQAETVPHPDGMAARGAVPATCAQCHPAEGSGYGASVHGVAAAKGVREAPVCTSCHGVHTIRPPKDRASSVWRGAVSQTCAGCHASVRLAARFGMPADRVASYADTYHGLAARRGDLTTANCASCHGFHEVLPAGDPKSPVNPANLARTCGQCHPGAGVRLAGVKVHNGAFGAPHWTVQAARWFYLFVIPLTIGFMLAHNLADYARKAARGGGRPEAPTEVRLTVGERWQHGVLFITFGLLAVTGFALKYPEAGWAAWLSPFAEDTRRNVHRWAAVAFVLLGAVHVRYLLATARGREILGALLPRRADWTSFRSRLRFFATGRAAAGGAEARFGYAEKVEYWSLVWGSLVMVVTGGVLVFHDLVLRFLAPWVPDLATTVHFYEAILACSAIVVWHLYGVIFDPDVYPMNLSWLTGRIRHRGRSGDGKGGT